MSTAQHRFSQPAVLPPATPAEVILHGGDAWPLEVGFLLPQPCPGGCTNSRAVGSSLLSCWGTHLLGDMCLVHENARFFPKAGATCPPRESEVQFPGVPQPSGPVPWPSSACPGCSSLALPQKLLTSNIFSCSRLILVPGFWRLSHCVCLLKFVVCYIFKIRGDEYFPFLYSLPCFFKKVNFKKWVGNIRGRQNMEDP